ncbi:hypothetical protein CO659_08765 [Rhizobium sp. S9]|nr:hypothetical protein CO659_08765 [Rhizobium sp. S9]
MVIHARSAPYLSGVAGSSSVICFNVHFFPTPLAIVDLYSFFEGFACGNPAVSSSPSFGNVG